MASLTQLLKKDIADLYPAYFALVMSTGIISIAASLGGFLLIARSLLYLNIIFYTVLWILLLCRLYFYKPLVFADLGNHKMGAGFLTIIAATCILGIQLLNIEQYIISLILYCIAIVLWLFIIYYFFTLIITKQNKPPIEHGIDGSWLLIVVSIESISILGTQLSAQNILTGTDVLLFHLSLFLLGCILYIILITLILYRLTFLSLKEEDYVPNYWINMGAVAIITLAGAEIILNNTTESAAFGFLPFVKGMILMFWTLGTWWIPIIIIMGIKQHIYKNAPFNYHPKYWSLVFPLGMYTVCTYKLGHILNSSFLLMLTNTFWGSAAAGWLFTFTGMINKIISYRKQLSQ